MAKRSRLDIITDILGTIQGKGGSIKPTHLMYKANLSHTQMKSYLEQLLEKEFVAEVKKKSYNYLAITEKGDIFLEKLKQMREFEESFGI